MTIDSPPIRKDGTIMKKNILQIFIIFIIALIIRYLFSNYYEENFNYTYSIVSSIIVALAAFSSKYMVIKYKRKNSS
jgi:cell shape-determining protein MreC